jgi:hypothetical protein
MEKYKMDYRSARELLADCLYLEKVVAQLSGLILNIHARAELVDLFRPLPITRGNRATRKAIAEILTLSTTIPSPNRPKPELLPPPEDPAP